MRRILRRLWEIVVYVVVYPFWVPTTLYQYANERKTFWFCLLLFGAVFVVFGIGDDYKTRREFKRAWWTVFHPIDVIFRGIDYRFREAWLCLKGKDQDGYEKMTARMAEFVDQIDKDFDGRIERSSYDD